MVRWPMLVVKNSRLPANNVRRQLLFWQRHAEGAFARST
jgi:hypothetical protein